MAQDQPVFRRLITQDERRRQDGQTVVRPDNEGCVDRPSPRRYGPEPREVVDLLLDGIEREPGDKALLVRRWSA